MLFRRDFAEILVAQRIDEGQVTMAFDQPRHERHAATVDRRHPLALNLIVPSRDGCNSIFLDENFSGIALVVLTVPNLNVSEQISHPRPPPSAAGRIFALAVL